MQAIMASFSISDPSQRKDVPDPKRHSKSGKKPAHSHSASQSSTLPATTYRDERSARQPHQRSDSSSYPVPFRADSAMSSRSDERNKLDATRLNRLPLADDMSRTQLHSAQQMKWTKRTTSRTELWPQALRIAKSPVLNTSPSFDTSHKSSSSESISCPDDSSQSDHKSNTSVTDASSFCSDSSSQKSSKEGHGYTASIDSVSSFSDQQDSKWERSPGSPALPPSARFPAPAPVNSLAAMGSAPRGVRTGFRRSRAHAPAGFAQTSSGSIDWTAVAPMQSSRHPASARMPTPPHSPAARHLKDQSIDAHDYAGSPATFDFPEPPHTANPFRNTAVRVLHSNPSPIDKQLPPHPHHKRRSLSADLTTSRNKKSDVITPITSPIGDDDSVSDLRSLASPGFGRPDKATSISNTIRELNNKSGKHFERYTRLRQARQVLSGEMVMALQQGSSRSKDAKTPLQLQLEIANLDAGIDDCMWRISYLEKKRQRLMDDLLNHIESSPTGLHSRGHSRNTSVGIQEIIYTPKSPAFNAVTPSSPAFNSLASQMSSVKAEDKYKQKDLPSPPKKEVRQSAASLSLANVMDFLDQSDEEAY